MKAQHTQKDKKLLDFSRIEKFHPYKTFLFFGLLGSTVVFMTIIFLYARTIPGLTEKIKLPDAFFLSAVLLLFSSYFLSQALEAFRKDLSKSLLIFLGITLGLGITVCILQVMAGKQMLDSGLLFEHNSRIMYLCVLSGIHFIHVIPGIIFLTSVCVTAFINTGDGVKSLLYFTDEYQYTKLELCVIFWHFINFLWLILFLIFLFTF